MSCRHPRFPIRENDRTRAIRGSDGAKTLSGRKRHLLGATGGLVLRVVVHPADVADRDGTPAVWADLPRPARRCARSGSTWAPRAAW